MHLLHRARAISICATCATCATCAICAIHIAPQSFALASILHHPSLMYSVGCDWRCITNVGRDCVCVCVCI